jgi:peptidoglycan/LPS O-acetylase OafA/YrhL
MNYRREVDGLRALAVLPVILFHAQLSLFSGGFVGVDVFFVISGYLITTIILNEKRAGTFTLINFWERRARRILPALFVVMLTCLPFAWAWLPPQDMKSFSQSLVAVAVYASNILFWLTSGYFETSAELKPLLHTWSLAVEEQFYLFFPIFLMLVWRLGQRSVLILLSILGISSLIAAQIGSVSQPDASFYLLPTRGWELLIGSLIAFHYTNPKKRIPSKIINELGGLVGLILLTYSIFIFNKKTPFPSLYTLVPTMAAAFIILFSSENTYVGKLLGHKIFVGIGLISYSAYLWHQPLFAFIRHRTVDEPTQITMIVLAISSLGLAYFTWKYIETPFRSKKRFDRKQIFLITIFGSIFFIVIGTLGNITNGFQNRVDKTAIALSSINMTVFEGQVKDCWQRLDLTPNISSACTLGSKEKTPSFALIGDSHAGALLYEIATFSHAINISGVNYSYKNCSPLKNVKPIPFSNSDNICIQLRQSFFNNLDKDQIIPKTIIASARWPLLMERNRFNNLEGGLEDGIDWVMDLKGTDYAAIMQITFIESLQKILKSGRKLILVYPVPEMGWTVPERLSKIYAIKNSLIKEDASTLYSVYKTRNQRAVAALDAIGEHENLIRIKPDQILCDTIVKNRCAAHLNSEPLYYDDDHLSSMGAKLVVREIMKHVSQ